MTYPIKYLPGDLVTIPGPPGSFGDVLGLVTNIIITDFRHEPDYIVFTNSNYCFSSYANRDAGRYSGFGMNKLGRLVDKLIETPFNSICRDDLCTLKDIYKGCPDGCLFNELTSENDVYLPLDVVREIFTGTKYKVIGLGLAIWSGDLGGYYDSYKPVAPWSLDFSDSFMNDLNAHINGFERIDKYSREDIDIERIFGYLKQDRKRYKLIYHLCNPSITYLTGETKRTWLPQNRLRLWKRSKEVYTFLRAGMLDEICARCIYVDTDKCNDCRTKEVYNDDKDLDL